MLLLLASFVLVATVLTELSARRGWLPYWVARKVLHFLAIGSCAVAVTVLDRTLLTLIVTLAELILIFLVTSRRLMEEDDGRPAWGIIWFPLAFLFLLLVEENNLFIAYCMAVLAICDPVATVVGKTLTWRPYQLTGDQKSVSGSLAFYTAYCFLQSFWEWNVGPVGQPIAGIAPTEGVAYFFLPGIILAGALLTLTEGLGSRGLDNLLLPLVAYGALRMTPGLSPDFYALNGGFILAAALFYWFTVRRRSLAPGGAFAAVVFAYLITWNAGPLWLLPLLCFFVSSVVIGKLFPSASTATDAKHARPRDAMQVGANGGPYVLLCLLFPPVNYLGVGMSIWELSLLCLAAIATADTWSSEIGQYFRWPTVDLMTWKKVPPGLSGGVSLPGMVAGLFGATLIAMLGYGLVSIPHFSGLVLVAVFGFIGMLIDSLIGSLFQAKYRNKGKSDNLLDQPLAGSELHAGYSWMNNDLVNLVSITIGGALFLLAYVVLRELL